jgi:hypothetical protein
VLTRLLEIALDVLHAHFVLPDDGVSVMPPPLRSLGGFEWVIIVPSSRTPPSPKRVA